MDSGLRYELWECSSIEELWTCGLYFLLLPDNLKASDARVLKAKRAHSSLLLLQHVECGEPGMQAFPSAIAYLRDGIVERINDKVF